MATQSIADLSVDVKAVGLAGLHNQLDRLQNGFKQAASAAERVQRSLTSGMQQARTGVSQLSTSAAQAQRSIANMGTAFRAANDNVGRLTPRLEQLKSSVDGTNASMEREVAQLQRVERETKRASRAKQDFNNASRRAQSEVNNLVGRLRNLAAGYIGLNAAINLVRRSLSTANELRDLSQQTGIAVDRLSELKFAADSLGVSFNSVSQAAIQFGDRVRAGLTNPSSEVGQAIRALAVDLTDASGNIRSFADVLPEIADRFVGWQDGTNKTRIATALFGQELGIRLLPLLNRGSLGLRHFAEEARKYGFVIDQEATDETQRFREESARLDHALQNLSRTFILELGPAITDVIGLTQQAVEWFGNLYREAIKFQRDLTRNIDLSHAIDAWEKSMEAVRRARGDLNQARDALEAAKKKFGEASPEVEHLTERYDRLSEALQRATAEQRNFARQVLEIEARAWETIVNRAPPERQLPPGLTQESETLKQMADELQQFMQSQAQFAQDIALQQTGLIENMILTEEQHARAVEQAQARIREAYGDTLQAQMMITEMQRELQRQHQEAILDTAQMAGRTLTMLFPKSKAAAIAEGIMNTAVGVTRALRDVPWPLNWIQAGLVAAAGAAQIASIRSANLSGSGSLPRTPTTGGSTSSSQPAAPPSGALIIQMPRGGFWSNDAVAELIERINSEVKNGRTLISTQTVPF